MRYNKSMKTAIKMTDNYIYIGEDTDNMIGFIKYYINRNGIIIAEHTLVIPEAQGKGYAKKLFLRLIELAESKNTKITAYCSYVHQHLNTPEFARYLA
ncbi:MAG TPA: GNAT family N-acetyltransferase [Bacilli bacterium]|nr:GNAT family N-acetyltransferase [Bacilli bacterium]